MQQYIYVECACVFMHKNTQKYADAATFLHSSYRDNNEKEQSISDKEWKNVHSKKKKKKTSPNEWQTNRIPIL